MQITKLSNQYRTANKHAIILNSAFVPLVRMAVMCGFLISLIYGGIAALDGQIAVASYSILIFLSQRLLWPLTYLGQVTDMYQRSMAAINRVIELLHTPITVIDGSQTLFTPVKGSITFDKVDFAYLNRNIMFNNLSFTINAREAVAFVGATGAGKSTLVKLILHLYSCSSGRILLDNVDICSLKLSNLRQHIGIVSQETFLVDGTISENIAYGSFSSSHNEIVQVAQLVGADKFINELPETYSTLVGERGQKLSGGQRQRLALARAILKNPAILILDEATSSLDNKTENDIQQALTKVIKNRTTIIVAHRLSTIVNVNKIYVLANGRIIEVGTHNELLMLNGVYANLWRLQANQL